ncbi:hypothetical protein PG995_005715 [Apiospora arundinis]
MYALGHNAAIFPEPFVFKPERWMSTEEPTMTKPMQEAFSAFSIGPRNCVGKPLAYLETSIVLAKTFWYFDFEPAAGPLGAVGEVLHLGCVQCGPRWSLSGFPSTRPYIIEGGSGRAEVKKPMADRNN